MAEVENYTRFHLFPAESEIVAGHISEPPAAIPGGERHGVVGHKTSGTATGCAGVVSWNIKDNNEKLVLMYSIPYSHDFHKNWIGIGLFPQRDQSQKFHQMYSGQRFIFSQ